MRFLPWETKRTLPAAEPPECHVCERRIVDGEVVVLDGDTYDLEHGAHAAVTVLVEAAEGDDVSPRVLEDAQTILRTLAARARRVQ